MSKRRLAFDPGKTGGWALLDDDLLVEWGRMPVTKSKPPRYDYKAIDDLYAQYRPDQCVIEKVNAHASPSASGAFSLGGCFEMLAAVAALRSCPVVYAPPQGKAGWPQEMVSGPNKADKAAHRDDAARLFPEFLKDSRVKANDGPADAILMAEWARRRNL